MFLIKVGKCLFNLFNRVCNVRFWLIIIVRFWIIEGNFDILVYVGILVVIIVVKLILKSIGVSGKLYFCIYFGCNLLM